VEDLFRAANHRSDGKLDYLQWSDFLALLRLGGEESVAAAAQVRPGLSPDSLFALLTPAATVTLSPEERARLRAVLRRADDLARAASSAKVAIMVRQTITSLSGDSSGKHASLSFLLVT
jgi:hypothetical protein